MISEPSGVGLEKGRPQSATALMRSPRGQPSCFRRAAVDAPPPAHRKGMGRRQEQQKKTAKNVRPDQRSKVDVCMGDFCDVDVKVEGLGVPEVDDSAHKQFKRSNAPSEEETKKGDTRGAAPARREEAKNATEIIKRNKAKEGPSPEEIAAKMAKETMNSKAAGV